MDRPAVAVPALGLTHRARSETSTRRQSSTSCDPQRVIVDLTESPPRTQRNKRSAPDELTRHGNSGAQKAQRSNAGAKKAKGKEVEEKRLARWRHSAPRTFLTVRSRALTQRMFVLGRERDLSDPSHPIEIVTMVGTTGNVYTVVIDKLPTCDCPHAIRGNQCKHILYVLLQVLRVRPDLEYQAAFLSSELREIFAQAPPLPSERANESARDGKRRPVEGECPICCEDFDPNNSKEEVVYCKAACGNNIHGECFKRWASSKTDGVVTCPLCRSPWKEDPVSTRSLAKLGRVNGEGYVNVAAQLGLSRVRDESTYNMYGMRHWSSYL